MGPGGKWEPYGTLHLQRMLGTKRPSVVSIRRTCDIQSPTTESYPLRQRLTLHCAFADATLPRPQTLPDADHWELADDGLDEDHSLPSFTDGTVGEIAPRLPLVEPETIAELIAVQPDEDDGITDDRIDTEAQEVPSSAVNPDISERAAAVQALQREIETDGRKPPASWRIDTFREGPRDHPRLRHVSVPPWSLRPPSVLPEEWLRIGRPAQRALRDAWAEQDPTAYNA